MKSNFKFLISLIIYLAVFFPEITLSNELKFESQYNKYY